MKIIADITKCFKGAEPPLLTNLRRHFDSLENASLQIFCTAEQFAVIERAIPGVDCQIVEGTNGYPQIVGRILNAAIELANSPDPAQIFSFHTPVIELATRFPDKVNLQFLRWGAIRTERPGIDEIADPLSRFPLSKQEILTTVRTALQPYPFGCRQTDLRATLAAARPEFNKSAGFGSNLPGFISSIVNLAQKEGLISVNVAQDPNNPLIHLKIPEAVQPKLSPTAEAPQSDPPAPPKSRSTVIQEAIASAGFGPFSIVRPFLYDAIEKLVVTTQLSATRLIQQSIDHAKRESTASETYPWWGVQRFLRTLLGARQILWDINSSPIDPNSSKSMGAKIGGLEEGWRLKLDAEILWNAIKKDGSISAHDLPYIAGVMFNDRSEESIEKIELLFCLLDQEGRLTEKVNLELGFTVFSAIDPGSSAQNLQISPQNKHTISDKPNISELNHHEGRRA